jgi:hypothetical protein
MQAYRSKLLIASVAISCFVGPAQAAPITKLEQQECHDDYHKFCGELGSIPPHSERAWIRLAEAYPKDV